MKKPFNFDVQTLVIDFGNMDFFQMIQQKAKSDLGSALMDLIESPFVLKDECKNIDFSTDEFMFYFWEDIFLEITRFCSPNKDITTNYELIDKGVLINVFENGLFLYSVGFSLSSWLSIAQTMQAALTNEYGAIKRYCFSTCLTPDVDYNFFHIFTTMQKILSERMDKKKATQK